MKKISSLLAIPDNDRQGSEVVAGDRWKLPLGSKYMKWKCDTYFKDIDTLVNCFEYEDVKELISEVWREKNRVVTVEL